MLQVAHKNRAAWQAGGDVDAAGTSGGDAFLHGGRIPQERGQGTFALPAQPRPLDGRVAGLVDGRGQSFRFSVGTAPGVGWAQWLPAPGRAGGGLQWEGGGGGGQ